MTNLANAMSRIDNAEKVGKKEVVVDPVSKMIENVLEVMKEQGYVGNYERVEDGRGDKIYVELIGRINKCSVITPRFPCTFNDIERFEKRYLPAKGFGVIILTTSQGVMTHREAKKKKIGGALLAYVY